MGNRNRNTALLLIAAGLFIMLGNLIGFYTVASIIILCLGVYKLRLGEDKTGYVLIAIGVLILASGHFMLILAAILISLGYFIIRSRELQQGDNYVQKHQLLGSIRKTHEPWELKNMSVWSVIGEVRLDLSLAVSDAREKETTFVFQGIIGDIDLIVPDDIGVAVHSTIFLGQTQMGTEKEAGFMNKLSWRSSHYETSEHKVNLVISYLIGDLKIRRL